MIRKVRISVDTQEYVDQFMLFETLPVSVRDALREQSLAHGLPWLSNYTDGELEIEPMPDRAVTRVSVILIFR